MPTRGTIDWRFSTETSMEREKAGNEKEKHWKI